MATSASRYIGCDRALRNVDFTASYSVYFDTENRDAMEFEKYDQLILQTIKSIEGACGPEDNRKLAIN
jgi:hypothetical protein